MPEDLRTWAYNLFQPLDRKVSELSNTQSEHKMALKILGAGLVLTGTAVGALVVGVIIALLKMGGIG